MMVYENMPLYPGMKPAGSPDGCMKVRLFDDGCCSPHRSPAMYECERVTIENPCRRGDRAEVILGVDAQGNLVICVHRDCVDPCEPYRPACAWPQRDRCCVPARPHAPCRRPRRGCGSAWD